MQRTICKESTILWLLLWYKSTKKKSSSNKNHEEYAVNCKLGARHMLLLSIYVSHDDGVLQCANETVHAVVQCVRSPDISRSKNHEEQE